MSHDNAPVTFTVEAIAAAVKKIATSSKSAARAIETVLVMAVYDSIVNKSATTANALIGVLRASTKKDGINAFLQQFGQLALVSGKFSHFALGLQEHIVWDGAYCDLVQEEAQNWESFKPAPKTPDALDIVAALESVVKRAGTAAKKGDAVVNADLVPFIGALIAQYSSRKAIEAAQTTAAIKAELDRIDAAAVAA